METMWLSKGRMLWFGYGDTHLDKCDEAPRNLSMILQYAIKDKVEYRSNFVQGARSGMHKYTVPKSHI